MSDAPQAGGGAAALDLLIGYGAATVALYLGAQIVGRAAFGLKGPEAAMFSHLSANGNVGFLGVALAIALLGETAAAPVALALTFDIVVIFSLTTALLSLGREDGGGVRRALARAFLNPVPISVALGLLWGWLGEGRAGLETPAPVETLLVTLGSAAPPAALFAVGATLAHKRGDERMGEIGALLFLKLAAHPLLTLAAFAALVPDADPIWMAGAVLAAACPASNNAVVLAGVFRVYEARASATVLVSTALAAVTIAAFVAAAAP